MESIATSASSFFNSNSNNFYYDCQETQSNYSNTFQNVSSTQILLPLEHKMSWNSKESRLPASPVFPYSPKANVLPIKHSNTFYRTLCLFQRKLIFDSIKTFLLFLNLWPDFILGINPRSYLFKRTTIKEQWSIPSQTWEAQVSCKF